MMSQRPFRIPTGTAEFTITNCDLPMKLTFDFLEVTHKTSEETCMCKHEKPRLFILITPYSTDID